MDASPTTVRCAPGPAAGAWMALVHARVHAGLDALLATGDEARLDPRWQRARALVRAYVGRPGKRLRPALVLAGHGLATGDAAAPEAVWHFAAAMELLHGFVLVHDDVADGARTRRGDLALHRALAPGRAGEDLAVVVGDHLFARAVEGMLACDLPGAPAAVAYCLRVCRHTAAGQFLDLELARAPLAGVRLRDTLRVAHLKTARYGFVAPLACGALLGGAPPALVATLERAGRHAGIAFQLRDDLIGLFGDARVSGKSADDLREGKRTFPVLAAWLRAPERVRREVEALWDAGAADDVSLRRARRLVALHGGRAATERLVQRATRAARRALATLPAGTSRTLLAELIDGLATREA